MTSSSSSEFVRLVSEARMQSEFDISSAEGLVHSGLLLKTEAKVAESPTRKLELYTDAKECLLGAIRESDGSNHLAWYWLGHLIRENVLNGEPVFKPHVRETGHLPDVLSPLDCFVKTLAVNPEYAWGWHSLGRQLRAHQRVGVPGEPVWYDAQMAFAKAVTLDPQCYLAWHDLSKLLRSSVVEIQGEEVSRQDCLIKCLEVSPRYAWAWLDMHTVSPLKPITLNGKYFDSTEQCLRQAIECDPSMYQAWYRLGMLLEKDAQEGWTKKMSDDAKTAKTATLREALNAYAKSIEVNPKYSWAWRNLGACLLWPPRQIAVPESVVIRGREYTGPMCLVEACLLNDSDRPWTDLCRYVSRKDAELSAPPAADNPTAVEGSPYRMEFRGYGKCDAVQITALRLAASQNPADLQEVPIPRETEAVFQLARCTLRIDHQHIASILEWIPALDPWQPAAVQVVQFQPNTVPTLSMEEWPLAWMP